MLNMEDSKEDKSYMFLEFLKEERKVAFKYIPYKVSLSKKYKYKYFIKVPPNLPFHINFIISLSISAKYFTGILIGITLNLYIKLERADILILKFSI